MLHLKNHKLYVTNVMQKAIMRRTQLLNSYLKVKNSESLLAYRHSVQRNIILPLKSHPLFITTYFKKIHPPSIKDLVKKDA